MAQAKPWNTSESTADWAEDDSGWNSQRQAIPRLKLHILLPGRSRGHFIRPVSSQCQPRSSSATAHPPPSSSLMLSVPAPPPGLLNSWKKVTNRRQFTDLAKIWEFSIRQMWRSESLMHQKQRVQAFNEHGTEQGRAVTDSRAAKSKRWNDHRTCCADMRGLQQAFECNQPSDLC